MHTEIVFMGATNEMVGAMQAMGIPTGGGSTPAICPYNVGDFIIWPQAPAVAYRVAWRMLVASVGDHPARWVVALEQSAHPLAAQAVRASRGE